MSYETDLNNLALLEEQIEYNPEAELNTSKKVVDGTYLAELSLGKFGIEVKAPRGGGKPYLNVNIQGRIVNPGGDYDGYRVGGFIKTTVFESGTSPVHQMLKSCGATAPATQSLKDCWALIDQTLAGQPQCKIRTRWEASTKNSSGASNEYLRVRGMKNFTLLPSGKYDANYTFHLEDGTEVTVEARENIVDFQPSGTNSAASSGQ